MDLEELLKSDRPPKRDEITDADLARLFRKYRGLLKQWERDKAFSAATHENIRIAYAKIDELVEERTAELKRANEQLKQAEARLQHLNLVLRAIRNVNQLIVKEKDRDRLLKGACDNLIKTRSYYNAWFAVWDEAGGLVTTAEAGLGRDFLLMVEQMKRGQLSTCCQQALGQAAVVTIEDPLSTCGDCPLKKKHQRGGTLAIRLEHDNKVYGLLVASVPAEFAGDEEEHSLLWEVAGDIAFALHDMEMEEARQQAERAIQEAREYAEGIVETVREPLVVLDAELRVISANRAFYQTFKMTPEESTGRLIYELGNRQWDIPGLRELLEQILPQNTRFDDFEVENDFETIGRRVMLLNARRIYRETNKTQMILLAIEDITERKEAEEEIKKAKERVEQYLSIAGVMLATIDADESITLMNKKGYTMLSYEEGELIGKNWFDTLIPERIRGEVRDVFRRLIAGDVAPVEYYENPLLTKDGDERLMAFHNAVIRDPGGQIAGVLFSGEDITERKQVEKMVQEGHQKLEQSEQKYRGLVEGINDGYLVVQNERVVFANQRAVEMVGYAVGDGIGRHIQEFLSPEAIKEVLEKYKLRLLGEAVPQQYETVLLRKDRTKLPVEIGVTFTIYEGSPATSVLIRDITERKQAEEKAREVETLKEIDRMRSGLLANVSHELRTPLASIKGFASTLLRTDVKWSEEEQRDFLQTIEHETNRLTRLINDLLDMSRIEAGGLKLDKRNCQIAGVLDSASNSLAGLTAHHRLEVIVPSGLPLVFVDETRIGQVLTNLVENATKYSREGSEITIEAKHTGEEIIVSVTDRGEGIAPELLDRVFDRFYQAESIVNGRKSGTGLGLSICRGIIKAHGGRIWVESQLMKGSRFSFSLPVGKGEEEIA